MNTLTKEWLLKTIAELEEERDAVPGIVNEDAAMSLAAMKIALASLEAEAVGEVIEQQSGMMLDGLVISEKPTYRNIKGIHNMKMMPLGTQFYTAPPAPVSVPDEIPKLKDGRGFKYVKDRVRYSVNYANGWNACRAAMLQGAEPVTTAYKLRDAVETIRNSGIEIDAEKIFAERDALNAPDCWCRTCRPITLTDMRFVVCPDCGNKRCPRANDHRNACTGSNDPGQEGSAYPAAPQQEVK
ncbi:Uncharacterised protein [Enterobacter hormaechei]|uniref:hypothetical protein n=1 Tax=Enterobacter hormaechei TaxID=158836 RepID=UPI00079BF8E2|nr:hypothetical protein [Enterobacter hormaechei]SAI50594.1 Uncharacterised protein [Enterobacter hormaechei]